MLVVVLLPLLEKHPLVVRSLVRNPDALRSHCKPTTQVVRGDVLDPTSLDEAMRGIHTAYYLVHLMSGTKDFEKQDRQAARISPVPQRRRECGGSSTSVAWAMMPTRTSRRTCEAAMKSAQILRDSGVETIEFRASIVIGAGQPVVSFDKFADRPIAGHALPPLAHDADAAHCRGRRAGLPLGGERLACG